VYHLQLHLRAVLQAGHLLPTEILREVFPWALLNTMWQKISNVPLPVIPDPIWNPGHYKSTKVYLFCSCTTKNQVASFCANKKKQKVRDAPSPRSNHQTTTTGAPRTRAKTFLGLRQLGVASGL
jgi:hypothetical protein